MIGPYEKKLNEYLKKTGKTLRFTSISGATSEDIAKEMLEIEEAFGSGECTNITNRPL